MGLTFPGTGMQVDKLWENKNTSAAFPEQKIPLDLSGYDAVLVTCSLRYAYGQRRTELIMNDGVSQCPFRVFSSGDQLPGGVRDIAPRPDGVQFYSGYYYAWDTQKYILDNLAIMPISIYGVRF